MFLARRSLQRRVVLIWLLTAIGSTADRVVAQPTSAKDTAPIEATTLEGASSTTASPSASIMPVGIQVGKRLVLESVRVRGAEDGETAIAFEDWLVPLDDVLEALRIKVNPLENGQLELRSPEILIRIDPSDLKTDPDLGLALTIA
ncbi:hypothetical protein H6F43_11705, partial [Leptolyngbya sp. FACHB-36]|nr:hypothetical protein [Leptolyngbya sp. FACHB-36]